MYQCHPGSERATQARVGSLGDASVHFCIPVQDTNLHCYTTDMRLMLCGFTLHFHWYHARKDGQAEIKLGA